jgi:bifunctional N-acetylglucosamine-1-phosphate-uridyltransferase/glucosamine-1-phosphate-acetyltransferase GlmU-like protein
VVSHTVAVDASVGDGATVGPYVHLPPGANVVAGAVTGAFYTAPVPD